MPPTFARLHHTTQTHARSLSEIRWLAVVLLAIGIVGCKKETSSKSKNPVRPVVNSQQVAAQGKLMPTNGITSLSAIPGDQIESILVKSGQQVSQGDVLVVMRSNQIRQLELQAAQTKLAEAKTQFKAKQTEVKLALDAASLKVEQATLAHTQAKKQLEIAKVGDESIKMIRSQIDRLKKLRSNAQLAAMIGQSEVDAKEIELQRAEQLYKSNILGAEQAVETTSIAIQLAEQARGAAEENIKLVDNSMSVESLEKQIELLNVQLEMTRVIAPSDATVLAVMASVGETAGPTPVIDVADLSSMICVAEVHEADVARLSIGDKAVMSSAALPSVLSGRVIQVDPLVGSPQMRLPNPLARSDFRAVPVRIQIDKDQQAIAARLVQLQVDVTITPSSGTTPEALTPAP